MTIEEYRLTIFADYFQFYLQDELVSGDLSECWTEQAVKILLALSHGTIGVGTIRNMDVSVIVKVLKSEPELRDQSQYDQINECDLLISSGKIVVAGCTDYFPNALRINVEPGLYRVRILYCGFETISEDGLDGDDSYEVQLWKSDDSNGLKVIKQYHQGASA